MAGENNASVKRKRPQTARKESGPPTKRSSWSSHGEPSKQDEKEHCRKVIKTMFKRYNMLSQADNSGQDNVYKTLIDSCEGEPCGRRLAARLLPRFAHSFPEKLDSAARALMDLSAWDGGGLEPHRQGVAEATRLEALQGLADICAAAYQQKTDSWTSSSINLHLLRRSQQTKGRARRVVAPIELECIQKTLLRILHLAPQAVLTACFESLSYNSGELFEAAMECLRGFLREGPLRNGEVTTLSVEDKRLGKVLSIHPKLVDWILAEVTALKGKVKASEGVEVLDQLLSAVQPDRKAGRKAKAGTPPRPAAMPKTAAESETAADSSMRQLPSPDPKPPSTASKSSKSDSPPENPLSKSVRKGGEQAKSRESSKARGSTEEGLDRKPSLKRKSKQNGEASGSAATAEKPAPPLASRVLAERVNGLGRAESGELLQDFPAPAGRRQATSLDPPQPGGACCLLNDSVFISGFQTDIVGEAQIRRECQDYGPVQHVIVFHPLAQAVVFFAEASHAIACYEGLNGEVRLARKPLEVQFCEDPHSSNPRNETPPRTSLWVAASSPQSRMDDILRDLADAGIEEPTKILRVGGKLPEALRLLRNWQRYSGSPRRRSPSPMPRGFSFRGRSPGRRTPPWKSMARTKHRDLPDYASCTLWIGQVGPEIDEKELIQAFERHGRLVGYKLLRGSMCGFIDFERIEDAASARHALHEAKFADCEIRVEFKEEGRALGKLGYGPAPRGRGGRVFGGPPMRGRGRFSEFETRRFGARGGRSYYEGSPPPPPPSAYRGGYGRGRGRMSFDRPNFPYSPRRGRSRSPYRSRVSSPNGRSPNGRSWTPSRSPVRLRRQSRGRYGGSFSGPYRSPRGRSPSADTASQRSRSPPPRRLRRDPAAHVAEQPFTKIDRIPPGPLPAPPHAPKNSPAVPMSAPAANGPSRPDASHALALGDGLPSLPSVVPRATSQTLPPRTSQQLTASQQLNASASHIPMELQRQGIPSATPTWSGELAKSGSVVCSIQCLEGPRQEAGGANGLEPVNWPAILDVTLRIDVKYVLNIVSVNPGVIGSLSAVRQLVLTPDKQQSDCQARFTDFCNYLTGRGRAGVVQSIPPAGGLEERTMYLIPPSEAVAASLKIAWQPQPYTLLAFIVPSHLKF